MNSAKLKDSAMKNIDIKSLVVKEALAKKNIKTAVYAGSFDPFTNGHLSVVKDAADVFDKVIICIAHNSAKKRCTNVTEMAHAISKTLDNEGITNVEVVINDGLVADYCKEVNAEYLVRGLRNTSDYMYEENIAKINYEINPDLKTIYFRATQEAISSSMVRELRSYSKDISKYVPIDILNII